MRAPRNFRRYAKAASNNFNTGVAKQFSAPVDSFSGGFGANKFQGAFKKQCQCLKTSGFYSIASP
jgi:hypothetical protein